MKYQTKLTLLIYNEDRSNHLRGETQIMLPFPPVAGICIQLDGMYPIQIVKVTWLANEETFHCIAEEGLYDFDLETAIDELTDNIDILEDAKKLGWSGFDKVYRAK